MGPPDFVSCQEGDTERRCLLCSLARAEQGEETPVYTAGQWDLLHQVMLGSSGTGLSG